MTRSRLVYAALARIGFPRLARFALRGAPVFCLHNVVAADEVGLGDASLHMADERFTALVDWASRRFELVTAGELARRARAGRPVRGLAALTFDDAYQGIFRHALPHLAAQAIPCTVFVVSGFGDEPRHTWWDVLAGSGLLTEARRNTALGAERGLASEVLAYGDGAPDGTAPGSLLPDSFLPASWEAVLAAADDGVEIGSHTARHPNLTALPRDELALELGRARGTIGERLGRVPESIAYPYGLVTPAVIEAARGAGYGAGFTLDSRPARGSREDLLALPRINVPAELPLDILDCWASGINPRRWLRRST